MDQPKAPKPPANLTIRDLPEDVAYLLHRIAYETGRTKRDLVIDAIRQTYGDNPKRTQP